MLLRLRSLVFCFAFMAASVAIWAMPKFWSAPQPPGVPYGVVLIPGTKSFGTQDFAIHLNFLRQIWHKSVAHPYRLEDQERIMKTWYPRMASGFPHAYSPVSLALILPLLALSPSWAYFTVTFLNAILLLLLTWFYLLPRIRNSVQAGAVLASFFGNSLFALFLMGQTALATTSLLAAGFALLEVRAKQTARNRLAGDCLLGGLFYLLAVKPSAALILAALLAGERAWKSLLVAGAGLMLTWALLANHYGGYWSGLRDYLWLLNHYCQSSMPPYLRPGLVPVISTNLTSCLTVLAPQDNGTIFLISRFLFEGLILALVAARWLGRISLSIQFQGLLWTFLLFCPHLLAIEDFAICLLVVQGTFFRPGPGALGKILLVFLMVNLCMGLWTKLPFFFADKLLLAGWWLVDLIFFQPRLEKSA